MPGPAVIPAFKRCVFLCGANMSPEAIRQQWPQARFRGIARADGIVIPGERWGEGAFGDEVWGIIVDTGEEQRGMPVPLTRRDGTADTAMLTGAPVLASDAAAILAEAHYWELPAAYRDRIQAWLDRA